MSDRPATERELLRWAEALSSTAMTGLGFTDNLYERERFEEVLEIAADQLPVTDFVLYSNGHFGATFDGEQLSSPEGFGVVKLAR